MLTSALKELSDLNRQRKNEMRNPLNKNSLTEKKRRSGSFKGNLTPPLPSFFIESTPKYQWQLLPVNGWESSVAGTEARVQTQRGAQQSLELLRVGGLEPSK